jgi:hypothetical protein
MQHEAKSTRALAFGGVLVMVVAVLLGGGQTTAQAGPPEDAVLDWNLNAVDALFNASSAATRPGAGQPPPVASQHLAMVQGAVYDAVNMIEGGHEPYLDGLPSAPASASKPAAVATAAHDVLVGLGIAPVPALPAATQTWLNDAYSASLAAIPDGQAKTDGISAGAAAAAAMLGERTGDGRYVPSPFTCGEGVGEWRPTNSLTCIIPPVPGTSDPFAWVANVVPFVLKSSSQFRTKGPEKLTSRAYAREYDEVKSLGSNVTPTQRTPEQQAAAQFFTLNPVTTYSRALRTIAQGEGLSIAEDSRLFAMVHLAVADALIHCWDEKVRWSNWRPITAIRLGDSDPNDRTVGDSTWTSFAPNPPYPDHISGYNCVTGSFMHGAKAFFGTDKVSFDLTGTVSLGFPGPTPMSRHYNRFTDVIDDTIDARVWQGIHFRSSDEDGARVGKKVARWVDKHYLEPVDHHDDDEDDD